METERVARAEPSGSLKAGIGWSLAGTLCFAFSQLGVVVVIARLATPAAVGQFGLALALAIPVFMLTNLGLRIGAATETRSEFDLGDYAAVRTLGNLIALATLCIAAFVAAGEVETARVIILIAAAKVFEAYSDLAYGVFQRCERLDRFALSMLIRGPVTLVVFAGVLAVSGRLDLAVVVQLVVWAGVALGVDAPAAARLSERCWTPRFDRDRCLRLIRLSLPLGVGASVAALHNQAPRLAVAATSSLATLGLFQVAAFPLQGLQMVAAIGQAIVARLARLRTRGRRAFLRLAMGAALAVALVGLVGAGLIALTAHWLVPAVFGEAFAPVANAFSIMSVALAVKSGATLLQFAMLAERRFATYRTLQFAVLAATVAALVLVVPTGGPETIAWSLVWVSAFHAVLAAACLYSGAHPMQP